MEIALLGFIVAGIVVVLVVVGLVVHDYFDFDKTGTAIICSSLIFIGGCIGACADLHRDKNLKYEKKYFPLEVLRDKDTTFGQFYLFLGTGSGESGTKTIIAYYIKYHDDMINDYALKRYEADFNENVSIVEKSRQEIAKPYLLRVQEYYDTKIFGYKVICNPGAHEVKRFFYVPVGTVKREFKLDK